MTSEEISCVPTLSPSSASLPQGGGPGSFNVSTPSVCDWAATPSANWITITGDSSGTGSGPVNYSVAANDGPQRVGTITVNGQAFNITQAPNPASCTYSLNIPGVSISEQGGSSSFTLTTGGGCTWNATSNASWLTVTPPTSGAGPATINYSVAANSGQQRTGVITAGGRTFTVTQSPNQASCTFALNPSSWQYPVEGGSGSFSVTTGAGCHWDAANANGWITITGGATGPAGGGNGTVSFTVQANNGGSRTGGILVRGQVFTVTQCGYEISPTSATFTQHGGSGSVTVSAAAGCSWSATSNESWITITSGASGAGNGIVNYAVDNYNECAPARLGTLTVAGRTVSIAQFVNGGPCCIDPTCCTNPPSCLLATGAGAGGLTARYFGNTTLSGQPTLERIDPAINFRWAGRLPDKVLARDGFSARWNGQLAAPTSEAYTFYLYSGGGARLWVNNQLVIDRWRPSSEPYTRSAPVELKVGEKAPIRVEYYAGENAAIHLLWSSASTPMRIVPPQYLYPEAATNLFTPADTSKQTGILLPPGSNTGLRATHPYLSKWVANLLSRAGLALLIAGGVLALLLSTRWRQARRRFATATAGVVSRLRDQIAWLGSVMHLGRQKLAGLLLEVVRTVAWLALSLWRGSGVARLKPVLRRALVIALIVRLAAPLTPAETEGLALAAQTAWREVSAYTSAAVKRSVKTASGARPVKVISMAAQSEQVMSLQVCPSQLIMFVGERYTLTPVALNGNQQVVHGAGMSWNSLNAVVAAVSSFGQVEAMTVGTTTVEVQSGGASKQIPIEVRSGTRPTGSNQEADLDTGDCSEEQASMYAPYAPQAKAAASAQQNLIDDEGVLLDWDPAPLANSRATHFRNAVGNPRFTARSRAAAAVPTNTQLGSYSYQFNVPVVSVGGRGASASIGMTLNSRVWNADDGKLTFNYVGAYPGPGWSMGYGKIIRNYNATATGDRSGVGSGNSPGDYLLITGDGTRIRLAAKYNATPNLWFHESDDGSFLQFDPKSGEMRYPDGSRMIYSSVNGCLLPTAMINSNGGAITMTYRDYCEGNCVRVFRHRTALSAVRDTLGRYVTFHYYGDNDYPADAASGHPAGELAAVKAPDKDGIQQEVIQVEYQYITLKYDFGGMVVDAPANNSQIQVVKRVYYPQTGRGFLFLDYSSYGMPRKISSRMGMRGAGGTITDGTEIAYTTYNYTTIAIDQNDPPYGRNQVGSLNDFPQFTHREEWWLGKTNASGAPTTDTTKYEYRRTTDAATEVARVIHLDRNVEEVTTTGTDSSQLSFGKMVSVELKKSEPAGVLSKQVFTYMTGPAGEVEIEKVETFDEAGQGTQVSFSYGQYGRVINKYEYGYKQGGVYQVRRRTQYDYIDDQNYIDDQGLREARFLRLVSRVSIFDESGATKAKTQVEYDNYAAMGGMESYGLSSGAYPPNHDATYNQSYVLRGNPTAVTTFSKIVDPAESTTRRMRYDIFGNVVEAEVSCCVKKFFGLSSATAYSQPDWVRSGVEAGLNLQTNYQYNYFTGLVISETNPDGQDTVYDYDDALRLERVTLRPTDMETRVEAMTHFEQDGNRNDLLAYISQTSYADQGTTKVITSKRWFDGSGRVIRAGTGTGDAPDSYDMTAAVYDGWGRIAKRSNPYPGDANGNGSPQFWTINTYDELSRVTKVTLPGTDNQTILTAYLGATLTSGATVVVTDTVGRQRKSEVDGLRRLVKVTEQNPANGALEWETSYSYDVLNNLTQTNQGGQTRTFEYDAKSRLKTETTPEAGTITYDYTDFDAVSTRTDARGVITTYTYGDLNHLTGVSYNNVTGVATTAAVSIHYKDSSPGKGQVDMVTDGAGTESYVYDSLGRLRSCTRMIDGISYPKQYEYNAANQMTLMTYPSGKKVNVGRDDRGRLSALKRVDASNNVQDTYLSGINYRVDGLVSGQMVGDGTTESFEYSDDRLQLTKQKVMKGGATLLDLSYGYGAGAGKMGFGSTVGNSGQLVSVTGTINNQNRDQAFAYDNVGRLVTATGLSTQGSTQVPWARRHEYDRYGNRTKLWDAVSGGNQLQNMMIAQSGGMTTNQIASLNGTTFDYDASGNLTNDGAREYMHDAENRIVSVNWIVGGLSSESYGYDAGNRRVKKVVGGVVTHYIWEGNQVIAEYERGGSTQAPGIRYYHQDHLSTRVITDGGGAVKGTTDQLPFGEEIGVSGEGEKHKFGSYERDSTGLDYAVNRHYDPQQGRFNQVDPMGMGATSLADPQSLNRYSYVGNDPVNKIDPTGLLKRIPTLQEYGVQRTADFLDFYLRSLEFHGGGSGERFLEVVDLGREHRGGGQQSTPGQKDLPSLISETRKIIENATGDCAKLLGQDALAKFDAIKDNIEFNGDIPVNVVGLDDNLRQRKLSEVSQISAVTEGNQIYLNPGGYAFGTFYNFPDLPKHFAQMGAASQRDYALAVIIHEFLHTTGKFKPDSKMGVDIDGAIRIDNSQSSKNTKEVLKKCFPKK